MTRLTPLFLLLLGTLGFTGKSNAQGNPDGRLFELREYYPFPGKLEALNTRFREHTLAIFEKHGMQHVGYWVTEDAEPRLLYIIAFKDKADKERAWKAFIEDPEWQSVYKASIQDGRLVSKVDSTLLRLTDYSPAIVQGTFPSESLFELRTYKTTVGRLSNLDARFRDHTINLFEKHGAEMFAFFHKDEGQEGADDTLIYLISHPSHEAREAMFKSFAADPEWIAARDASEREAGGSLTQPGGVTFRFLHPTDYSLTTEKD